jgi:hypothetical protein
VIVSLREFTERVCDAIREHFKPGDAVTTRQLRLLLGIENTDWSAGNFISQALNMLARRGELVFVRNTRKSKLYKVNDLLR